TFNTVHVSMNGFLTFGSVAPGLTEHFPITSTATYAGAIAAYGWDLDLTASATNRGVSSYTVGVSPNRIKKFQWILHRSNGTTGAIAFDSNPLQFQIWLYEG